jgi:hypothetical protein
MWSYNPAIAETTTVWAAPRSLATTWGIRFYFLLLGVMRCFSSPRSPTLKVYMSFTHVGCPIRKSPDHRVFAPPQRLSQLITSFIASESQGIRHAPLLTFCFIDTHFAPRDVSRVLYIFLFLLVCHFNHVKDRLKPRLNSISIVENNGFEPLTLCVQGRCSSQLS